MAGWTDAHNHLQDARLGDCAPLIAAMRGAGVGQCMVNATRENDWPAVEALVLAEPDLVVPAFGIHPWYAHGVTDGWQDRLTAMLEKHPLASIGECGVDPWVSSPSMAIQRPVFREQLRLASELKRVLTIHCLKAWGALFEILAEQPPPRPFLMHAFGGSIETARRLIPQGAYFSFSGHFLHERKSSVLEVFRQLPRERILLETDAPEMRPPNDHVTHPMSEHLNHPANLPSIGRAFAAALGMSATHLEDLTRDNAARCFGL